jgi:hypothetical protein
MMLEQTFERRQAREHAPRGQGEEDCEQSDRRNGSDGA